MAGDKRLEGGWSALRRERPPVKAHAWGAWGVGRGGGGGGHSVGLFAFGGAYWPLTLAHSDPLWLRTCLIVSTEPLDDLSCLTTPRDGLLPVPLTRCIQMHTPSPCWVCQLQH